MSRALVILLVSTTAHADVCTEATACCVAAGGTAESCKSIAQAGAAGCGQVKQALIQALTAQKKAIPATCSGQVAGGGGADAPAPPVPPPASPEPKDQPPRPLPAEDDRPVADGGVACLIERVDGKRTILTGDDEQLQVKCTGAALDPKAVKIAWTQSTQVGELHAQLFDRAAYRAPAKVSGSANENVIHAKVTVAGHTVDAVRTMHVVNRHLRLTVTGHIATHCTDPRHGSVTVGFEVECRQTVDLEVGKDWSVSSSNPQSCKPAWTAMQGCMPGISPMPPQAAWALRGAVGRIDPDVAVMDLQIDGDRVGYPDVKFPSKIDRAHANALFPRPLQISPDDNAMRVFGSMTTTAIAGGQTIFELDAR